MHADLQMLNLPFQNNSRNKRRDERTPYRAQITINSRRKKNIPEIKIELDEMLTQAFTQMKMQPKKYSRIGTADLYILDNNLLRDYVTSVYDEYGIIDPLAQTIKKVNLPKMNDSAVNKIYQTPQKPFFDMNASKENPKNGHRITRTSQRISKLKKNFQSQLQTMPTNSMEREHDLKDKKIKFNQTDKNSSASRTQIKITRRPSQQLEFSSQNKTKVLKDSRYQSFLFKKTKHKYCLMCQEPLQSDLISAHQNQCMPLQRLLMTPNLKIEQIGNILNTKIYHLEEKLRIYQSSIGQDVQTMKFIIHDSLNMMENINIDQNEDQQSKTIKCFSTLSSVKCLQTLDKLKWFKKMKAKSQFRHPIGQIS